jgi:hypothetical protein
LLIDHERLLTLNQFVNEVWWLALANQEIAAYFSQILS